MQRALCGVGPLEAELTQAFVYEMLRSQCGVEFDAGVECTHSRPTSAYVAAASG